MDDILIIRQPRIRQEIEEMNDLVWKVLQEPWSQPKKKIEADPDKPYHDFIAILNDVVIGAARFCKFNDRIGMVQFIAVEPKYQLKGVGRNMMQAIHVTARNQRLQYIVLNAMEQSMAFFECFGYKIVEESPPLFNQIKQFKMIKRFR
ncbi:MAG: GNAT family N-acetyltransferase [Candidatus Helarchaeota archaeon]